MTDRVVDRVIDLETLAQAVPGARRVGAVSAGAPVGITGLAYDSRHVKPGDLFFCVRGFNRDGHQFLPDAVARGAVAAVVDTETLPVSLPALLVPDVRAAMPQFASAFYGHPSRKLALVGVTGTNGKTTTTYLVEALARAAGDAAGVIGTIGIRINGREWPAERTTPEAPDLQRLLAEMAAAVPDQAASSGRETTGGLGRTVVAMEVSSHALTLGRTAGAEFDVAVFTNLTQDHLDFHGDMESYFQAKALLFTEYPRASRKRSVGVLNADDPYGRRLAELCAGETLTYAIEQPATLRATEVEATPRGVRFRLLAPEGAFPVTLRLGGLFNVYNALAAMGAARAIGLGWDVILPALASASGVPGRFESVELDGDAGQDFGVIVDYAHTPDGLENVLRAARALQPRRLITVFGCGGDRDRKKRPLMGRIAADLADHVIVTSDNPRSEDPRAIVSDILAGIPATAPATVTSEVDRRAAIQQAVSLAEAGDLVVIAGKGHETYQIFADGTIHFDDREEAQHAIRSRLSR